jgi:acyl carrier protein
MPTSEFSESVRNFIRKNYIFDKRKTLADDESLIGSGIVDSTGILELINFLEEKFDVQFEDEELVPENFDSVINITAFLSRKVPGNSATAKAERL